jgi:superfamily II DNA or RNA helicase
LSIRKKQKDAYSNALLRWLLGIGSKPSIQPKTTPTPKTLQPNNPNLPTKHTQVTLDLQPIQVNATVKPIQLRPYQDEAIQIFMEKKKGVIAHATALGKTFIAVEAIRRIGPPVAIFVPTIAIMEQVWLRRLKEAGWGSNIGVYYGGKHEFRPITIFLYQSAIRHPQAVTALNPRLVIYDEVHHLHSGEWANLLKFAEKSEYALGLTATLDPYEPKNKPIISIMPIIHRMPIAEARKGGWVAPIEVIPAPAKMTYEERLKYEEYEEIIRRTVWQLRTSDPTVWAKLSAVNPVARKGLWAMAKRRMLLSEVKDKLNVLLEIVKKNMDRKILLFSESIRSVETAKMFLLQNGIPCETYHSKKNKNERQAILQRWAKSPTLNTLLSVTSLEEGLDVPDASVGIIYASGKTMRKIVQRLGRLIRKAPGKIAKIYVIHVPYTTEDGVLRQVQRAVWRVK